MTTVSMGAFLWGLFIALLVGFFLGAAMIRAHHNHVAGTFDRFRAAMLDDWRDASGKVARMRDMFRRARTLREAREMLWADDAEHPPLPVGIAVSRGRERR